MRYFSTIGLALVLTFVGIYHYILVRAINDFRKSPGHLNKTSVISMKANPLTNIIEIKFPAEEYSREFREGMTHLIMLEIIERELNKRAQADFDVYAMLIPYKIRAEFVSGMTGSP